jgi:hypothetical protein
MIMTDPKPLSIQQLDEIETRANAATDGPWTVSEDYDDVLDSQGAHLASYWNPSSRIRNGEFIAHARTDVPSLLAEIRRLRSELAGAAEDVSWLRCLEAAGVDNWEGIETAIDMRGE